MVVWQSSQVLPVGIWVGFFPGAVVPLWQEAQAPITEAWSTRVTGFQRVGLWQSSQVLVVAIWVGFLPGAVVPLWQDEHDPVTLL